MSAIGHGIAFATGAIDLPSLLGKSLGETQFKQLTVLAAFGLVGTCGVTCWAVTERVLISTPSKSNKEGGLYQVVSHIWSTMLYLPPRIRAICMAQFWAWIGWFPFLFYSTTWIGETYFRYDAPHDAKQSGDALGEVGRAGSQAFIIVSNYPNDSRFVSRVQWLLFRPKNDIEASYSFDTLTIRDRTTNN